MKNLIFQAIRHSISHRFCYPSAIQMNHSKAKPYRKTITIMEVKHHLTEKHQTLYLSHRNYFQRSTLLHYTAQSQLTSWLFFSLCNLKIQEYCSPISLMKSIRHFIIIQVDSVLPSWIMKLIIKLHQGGLLFGGQFKAVTWNNFNYTLVWHD